MRTDHSFAILAYKESPYLKKCIESLLNQTVKSEIFISTSTPSVFLENIAKEFSLPLIENKNQGGIASDWNFALQRSNTKYVTLAHQDDLYFSYYTELSVSAACKSKNNLITFSNYCELSKNRLRTFTVNLLIKKILLFPFWFSSNVKKHTWKKMILMFGSPINCPGVMYHKKNLGNFAFDSSFSINLDWEAWIRLAQREGRFVYVNKRLMAHRIYEGSETTWGIKENKRKREDTILFHRLWPATIAEILWKIYSLSYRSND